MATTTTTSSASNSAKQKKNGRSSLDFRDIHQHPPPVCSSPLLPLSDPTWDAHRVLFNERPREEDVVEVKKHHDGDALDGIFAVGEETPGSLHDFLGTIDDDPDMRRRQEEDGLLDPLGWPLQVEPAAFVVSNNTTQKAHYPTAPSHDDEDDDAEEEEDDALNLLPRRRPSLTDDDDDEKSSVNDGAFLEAAAFTQAHNVRGVEVAYNDNNNDASGRSQVVGYRIRDRGPSKESRLQQYETTGVDDESSVEEEEEEDPATTEADCVREEVDYRVQQDASDEDEVDNPKNASAPTDLQGFASFETTTAKTAASLDIAALEEEARQATEQMARLVVESRKKAAAATKPNKAKTSSSGGGTPLLRPPPAEKLAQWEAKQNGRPLSLFPQSSGKK